MRGGESYHEIAILVALHAFNDSISPAASSAFIVFPFALRRPSQG
jgi:hypothetical protein